MLTSFATVSSTVAPDFNDAPDFDDELAFAVSCVRRVREHAPTPTSRNRGKHMALIDGIALLLVTDDKSDVAAVSFEQTPTSINFFYAKNRPCLASEKNYIDAMLGLIQGFDPSKEGLWTLKIAELAVQYCIKKIRGRIKKIGRELAKCGITASKLRSGLGSLEIIESTGNLVSKAVVQVEGLQMASEPDKKALSRLFHFILKLQDAPIESLRKDILSRVLELIAVTFNLGMIDYPQFLLTRTSRRIN